MGMINPSICQQGFYRNNDPSIINCIPCPAGTYGNFTGATQVSQCIKCPSGIVCIGLNLTIDSLKQPQNDKVWKFCPAGYICGEGTNITNMNNQQCPVGKVCMIGGSNNSNNSNRIRKLSNNVDSCYKGRYCPAGSSASSSSQINVCQNDQNPNNCQVGKICPANSYCPLGTGDKPNDCKNRISFQGTPDKHYCLRQIENWNLNIFNRSFCYNNKNNNNDLNKIILNFNFSNIIGFSPDHYDLEFNITETKTQITNSFKLFKNYTVDGFSQIPLIPEARFYLMKNDFNFTLKILLLKNVNLTISLLFYDSPFYNTSVNYNCSNYVKEVESNNITQKNLLDTK